MLFLGIGTVPKTFSLEKLYIEKHLFEQGPSKTCNVGC